MKTTELDPKPISPEKPFDPGNRFQLPPIPRPILSTIDTYDQNTQIDDYTEAFGTGRRPLWNIPRVALTNEKIGTIKASASVSTVTPAIATQSGVLASPATTNASFSVVPNMGTVIKATGPVQISFSLNAQTVNANDPAKFAVFRDGVQVSQQFLASAGAANTSFSAGGTFTDNPPLGYHIYDIRWGAGASKLTAVAKQRTIQVLNLRAQ